MSSIKLKHLIAGPCSAETKNQVLATAKQIAKINDVTLFRAGIWKPRTSPNSFEGVGEEGLKWMQEARDTFKLKIITEVATPKHVEKCLKTNIDALWIGSRTTVNPFSVQEIVEVLKGVDIPIFIKNPISPDAGLWIGAIERFKKAGIENISVIHRGFYSYTKSRFRNTPMWEIPVKLKTEFPSIDVICDPSHIAGDSKWIEEVANSSLLYGMNGLMIETHINPSKALSDSKQQVTPTELKIILNNLKAFSKGDIHNDKLNSLRKEIDEIDAEFLKELSKRFSVVKEIAALKKEQSATFFQVDRWKKVLKEAKKSSKELNLEENLIEEILNLIHKESLRIHQEVYKSKTNG